MSISRGNLIKHNREIASWVDTLNELTEEKWRTKIANDKWSIAEIISHLSAWDYYIVESRLAVSNGEFPASPEVEEYNQKAAEYARNHPKEIILTEFADNRHKLIECIEHIEDHLLDQPFYRHYSILQYLEGFIEHDLHHQKQIVAALS